MRFWGAAAQIELVRSQGKLNGCNCTSISHLVRVPRFAWLRKASVGLRPSGRALHAPYLYSTKQLFKIIYALIMMYYIVLRYDI